MGLKMFVNQLLEKIENRLDTMNFSPPPEQLKPAQIGGVWTIGNDKEVEMCYLHDPLSSERFKETIAFVLQDSITILFQCTSHSEAQIKNGIVRRCEVQLEDVEKHVGPLYLKKLGETIANRCIVLINTARSAAQCLKKESPIQQ